MNKNLFIKNFMKKKKLFNKIVNEQKYVGIGAGMTAAALIIMSVMIHPAILVALIPESVVALPLIAFSQLKKHEIVKECNEGSDKPISYKEFKQMIDSGELEIVDEDDGIYGLSFEPFSDSDDIANQYPIFLNNKEPENVKNKDKVSIKNHSDEDSDVNSDEDIYEK